MRDARHEKLLVDAAAVGHDAHADWYRFGSDNGAERPLVAYFGGSISTAVYHARRESEPTSLVELFEAARLNFDDAQNVGPLPLRGAAAPLVPLQLGEDRVFGRRDVHRAFRLRHNDLAPAVQQLLPPKSGGRRNEDVDLEH